MCIRDSREHAIEAVVVEVGIPDVVGRRREDRDQPAIGEHPVSYTHLRAHETVLDLVCRLLLEKKKHKRKITHKSSVDR